MCNMHTQTFPNFDVTDSRGATVKLSCDATVTLSHGATVTLSHGMSGK